MEFGAGCRRVSFLVSVKALPVQDKGRNESCAGLATAKEPADYTFAKPLNTCGHPKKVDGKSKSLLAMEFCTLARGLIFVGAFVPNADS